MSRVAGKVALVTGTAGEAGRSHALARATGLLPVDWVEAADVSAVIAFLASDDARYITGAALPVDAGALIA
jgi:Enoyl-(Acyl carrier protein) reductase